MNQHYLKNGESLCIGEEACTGCGACLEVCPHAVFALEGTPPHRKVSIVDRAACMECGACARNCPSAAIYVATGVGCAAAVLQSRKKGSSPTCSCGEDSGCCV